MSLANTLYAFSLILAIFTIISNIVIIGLFLAHRDIRIARNYIIFSLAIADLTIGVLAIPFAARQSYEKAWPYGRRFCYSHVMLDVMCTLVSLFTVALTSGLDTFLVYGGLTTDSHKVYSGRNVAVLIAISWLGPMASMLIPLAFDNTYVKLFMERNFIEDFMVGSTQCLPNFPEKLFIGLVVFYNQIGLAFIVCAYAAIFYKIHKRHTYLATSVVPSQMSMVPVVSTMADQRFRRNKNFLKLTFSMAIITCICYFPGSIIFLMESLRFTRIPLWAFNFGIWLSYLKSGINPLLYGFLNAKFKAHICNLFGQKTITSSTMVTSVVINNGIQQEE